MPQLPQRTPAEGPYPDPKDAREYALQQLWLNYQEDAALEPYYKEYIKYKDEYNARNYVGFPF